MKAYHEKKSKKPALVAKTSVLLDIKPWDDETDMNEMLKCAKSITKEGLLWGACKYIPDFFYYEMFSNINLKNLKLEIILNYITHNFYYFSAKLVPVGYGINKWQLMCVVEDEKVSIDELCEQITEFEDFVQSCDVASMSKI